MYWPICSSGVNPKIFASSQQLKTEFEGLYTLASSATKVATSTAMPFTIQRSFYDHSHDYGFFSPSTSGANFCEEDYQMTFYVAEFVNKIGRAHV